MKVYVVIKSFNNTPWVIGVYTSKDVASHVASLYKNAHVIIRDLDEEF